MQNTGNNGKSNVPACKNVVNSGGWFARSQNRLLNARGGQARSKGQHSPNPIQGLSHVNAKAIRGELKEMVCRPKRAANPRRTKTRG